MAVQVCAHRKIETDAGVQLSPCARSDGPCVAPYTPHIACTAHVKPPATAGVSIDGSDPACAVHCGPAVSGWRWQIHGDRNRAAHARGLLGHRQEPHGICEAGSDLGRQASQRAPLASFDGVCHSDSRACCAGAMQDRKSVV